jgi:hypothetical protein
LIVKLRNTSRRTLCIDDVRGEFAYEVIIATDSGGPVRKTELGKHLTEDARGGSRQIREISPGEVVEHTVDVSKLYTLDPGKYFLRVARVVPSEDAHSAEKAISNAVSVRVQKRPS